MAELSDINEYVNLPEYYSNYSVIEDIKENNIEVEKNKTLCAIGFSYHGNRGCAFTVYPKNNNTTLNNITEYSCIFRSSDSIIKTAYTEDDFGFDDEGKPSYATAAVRKPLSTIIQVDDFPEHWSLSISNDDKIYCQAHAKADAAYQTLEPIKWKETQYFKANRTEIQKKCIGHILQSEFNPNQDYDMLIKGYKIKAEQYNQLIIELNKKIDQKNISEKYRYNGITKLHNANTDDIIKELKILNDTIAKMQPKGNDLSTGMRKHDHWIYKPENVEKNNLITISLINDFQNVIFNELQDCVCYSDCNGYSVCWCYGNCNYY